MDGVARVCKIQRLSDEMSDNQEKENKCNQIDGEVVLRDMMDNVCQYLRISDLSHVAQVCKSWNMEANREMEKRYLEFTVLPYLFSYELMDSSFHVSKNFYAKPYVTLLFPGANWQMDDVRDEIDLEYDTLKTYRKQFPSKLIVVGVFESMMNENLIHSGKDAQEVLDIYKPAGTLCLSLPRNKLLNIKESFILESEFLHASEKKFEYMINELIPEPLDSNSTIIIFVANPDGIFIYQDPKLIDLLKKIKNRFAQKSYNLWGLVTSYKIFASNKYDESIDNMEDREARFISLNLSGPNFESWSTVISVHITVQEMIKDLDKFKNRIRLKWCNMGLITAPVYINEPGEHICYSDNRELVNIVKKVLPEVSFLGVFCEDEDFYFGVDSNNSDSDELMNHEIISIMVFSYN